MCEMQRPSVLVTSGGFDDVTVMENCSSNAGRSKVLFGDVLWQLKAEWT